MKPTVGLAFFVIAVTVGCVTASIYKPDVIGPHGEHLIELSCATPDKCMDFARVTCKGDFDVVTSSDVTTGGGAKGVPVGSTNLMLIRCDNQPDAGASGGPDAGR